MNEDVRNILLEMQTLGARMTALRNKLTSLQGKCAHQDQQTITRDDATIVVCQNCTLVLSESKESQ